MFNIKLIINKLLQCFLIIISILVFCYSFTIYISTKNQTEILSDTYIENKYIKISDNYDKNGYKTFYDFISDKDSLVNMKNMYKNLNSNEIFDYIEVDTQNIELTEKYSKDIKFVHDNNKELVNQTIMQEDGNNNSVTALKSFQISEKSADLFKLKDKIYEGEFFTEQDYILNDNLQKELPVILGHSYIGIYNIGDEIEGTFLNKEFKFKVKGFLHKDTSAPVNYDIHNLDNSIIMPFVQCNYKPKNVEEYRFQSILYSLKSESYIRYNTNTHYTSCIDALEKLTKKYNLDYTYVTNNLQDFTKATALKAMKISKIILLFSIFIIIIISLILISMSIKHIDNNLRYYAIHLINGSQLYKLKFKIYSMLCIQFIIASIIAIYCLYINFRKTVYLIYFIEYIEYQVGFIFLLSICILFLLNIYMNKINICLAIRRKD